MHCMFAVARNGSYQDVAYTRRVWCAQREDVARTIRLALLLDRRPAFCEEYPGMDPVNPFEAWIGEIAASLGLNWERDATQPDIIVVRVRPLHVAIDEDIRDMPVSEGALVSLLGGITSQITLELHAKHTMQSIQCADWLSVQVLVYCCL